MSGTDQKPVLPRPLVVLGEALRPVSDNVARRMESVPPSVQPCLDIADFASRHLGMIEDRVARLADAVNHDLGAVTGPDTADSSVWRAASRVEVHIEGLLDQYDEVRRVRPENDDLHAHVLLGGIYHDLLEQIQTWLNDVLESVDDPVRALQKRGLPTEGHVEVTIPLTLEPPRQVADLGRWAQERTNEASSTRSCNDGLEREVADRGHGNWFTWVLIAFGLGWLLWDDGDDGDE